MSWVWTWIFKQLFISICYLKDFLKLQEIESSSTFIKKKLENCTHFDSRPESREQLLIHSEWSWKGNLFKWYNDHIYFQMQLHARKRISFFFLRDFFSFLLMRHDTQSRVISKDTQKITRWRFNLAIESRLKWRCILKCKTICYQKDHIKT